jgi:predicted nucleic acid-binding protein
LDNNDALSIGLYDHINDAIIATTAYQDNMILVTGENALCQAAQKYQLEAIKIHQLMELS